MIFTENNWFKWYYGESEAHAWPTIPVEPLRTVYGRYHGPKISFKDALVINAKATVDAFPGETLDLMFSGGVDSELVLRAYLEIGHPLRVNVFRYDNGYNDYDVSFALKLCDLYDVKPNIIDFNITRFYENDALDLMAKFKCSTVRALVQMTFLDHVDGIPVMGSGDPKFFRPHSDYSQKAEWTVQDWEYELAWCRYAEYQKRKAITHWFKWTNAPIAAMTSLRWFTELTGDKYHGKLGPNSTKLLGFKNEFPDLLVREKKTGFELTDHLVNPVIAAHEAAYGSLAFEQCAERSVTDFLREIWGT